MPRVVHFELNADDPARASRFYTDVFGWKIQKWEGPMDYWMCMTGDESRPGINGGLTRLEFGQKTINTIDVPSVDDYLKKIAENGGEPITEKMTIPGVGYLAYCKDTEGNVIGIIQMDESVSQ